jgi:hypothetical protein
MLNCVTNLILERRVAVPRRKITDPGRKMYEKKDSWSGIGCM